MIRKRVNNGIKALTGVAFLLNVCICLIGCTANPFLREEKISENKHMQNEEILEEHNLAVEEQKSTENTEPKLKGQQLIFKTDMDDLTEKIIPNYKLKKSVKHYTGNKEVGGRIFTEDGGQTSVINGEIRDQAVSMDEEHAVVKAKEWIETAFVEFDVSLLDGQEPLIMYMRKTELSNDSKEVITGYRIEYENQYDSYKIQGEGITVLLDDIGVSFGIITWNEYEKIDSPENSETAQTVDFEQSKILLENAIMKENEEFGFDENNQDARTVDKVELVFYGNAEEEYIPAWHYEMVDGRAYYVNCSDGQVSHP